MKQMLIQKTLRILSPKVDFATKLPSAGISAEDRQGLGALSIQLLHACFILSALINACSLHAQEPAADLPPLQLFVPGITVRELPVQLTNVNNVLYREDGVLVALAYDGNVYLLRDSDGDGLEDQVSTFWKNEGQLRAPIGMALTPPGYSRGRGVF